MSVALEPPGLDRPAKVVADIAFRQSNVLSQVLNGGELTGLHPLRSGAVPTRDHALPSSLLPVAVVDFRRTIGRGALAACIQ